MRKIEYFPMITLPKSVYEKLTTLSEYVSEGGNCFHFKSHIISGHSIAVSDDIQNAIKNPDNVQLYSSDFHEIKDILQYRRGLLKFLEEKELSTEDLVFTIRVHYLNATWLMTIRRTKVEFEMIMTVIDTNVDYKIVSICSEHDDFRMFQSTRNNITLEHKSNPRFNYIEEYDDSATNAMAFIIGNADVISDITEIVDHFVFIHTGDTNDNDVIFAEYLLNFE